MKQWMLVSSLLGICSALPLFPQHAGIPGMGSISLERTRQLGGLNIPPAVPQALPYSYADPFHSMWGRSFLPSHTFLWMTQGGPQRQDTQQYEYAMPVHPPPLPSLQTPIQFAEPRLPEQPFFQITNLIPTRQVQIPRYAIQPSIQQTFQQVEAHPPVDPQQQPLPAERQTHQIYPALHGTQQDPSQQLQQQSIYPSLYYMPYVANQGAAPARQGIVSSEEMQGGGFGAPAYRAPGPDLFAMDTRFGNSPLNQPGDYTVEDDTLGITEQPDVKGGANAGANPSGKGNNAILLDGTQGGALPNANSHLFSPAGQSQGLSGLAQATAAPHATQGPFLPLDAADPSMPLDAPMFPDLYTSNVGNEAGLAQVGQDAWHFQEP
ncbi:ameloblastin precursor [Anolis carolinensis]|uniref:Ameloblastin n=1 Tax=Anolis carolinensis TaxID=28377 RepID=A0A0K2GMW1_ANOCA|nr:ameloblastin precursor [Anolis carolinensis]ALA62321.1 ameloblastin [Anolis carolinensis]